MVSLEQYLHTSYEPECEYLDGVVVQRNTGERPHSAVLTNLIVGFYKAESGRHVWPILRMRTGPSRIRVPDICVSLGDPKTDIMETPPFLCIEVVSPEDGFSYLLEKLEEYVAKGGAAQLADRSVAAEGVCVPHRIAGTSGRTAPNRRAGNHPISRRSIPRPVIASKI